MFIGGSPVGTAGGVKTVTAAIVVMNAVSYIRGKKETVIFKRRVSEEMIKKSSAVILVSLNALFVLTFLLLLCSGVNLTDGLFEAVSALATVGLTRSLTPTLNIAGKLIIIVGMYLGRIGPISMALFFTRDEGKYELRMAEGRFYTG